jgi:hypothetical protein
VTSRDDGRRCRICEKRAMSDRAYELPPNALSPVTSPNGIVHLAEGTSGYTICGRDCAAWESRRER